MEGSHGVAHGVLVVPPNGLRYSMPHRTHLGSARADIAVEVTKATGHEHDEYTVRVPP